MIKFRGTPLTVLTAIGVIMVVGVLVWVLRLGDARSGGPTAPSERPSPNPDDSAAGEAPGPVSASDDLVARSESLLSPKDPTVRDAVDQGRARDYWVAEEQKLIDAIARESFEQTLDMSGDWSANQYERISQDEHRPTIPSSLYLILSSRRFAKVMEETQAGATQPQIESLTRRLDADSLQWGKLSQSGQSLRASSVTAGGPGYTTEDLLFPLTYRMNCAILIAGERAVREALPSVVRSADATGVDTNWAACAYACDKILTSSLRDALSPAQSAALDEYLRWKKTLKNSAFADYKIIELPSYKSVARPIDRTTWTGMTTGAGTGMIKLEMPPIYRVFVLQQPENGSPYFDDTGTTDAAKRIVEYARKFSVAAR